MTSPFLWNFWHPHQKIWNWGLVGAIRKIVPIAILNKPILMMLVWLDSMVLFLQALVRRVTLLGFSKVFSKAQVPDSFSVLYFDMGTHREGDELAWMVDTVLPEICSHFEAYGFEANQKSHEQVKNKFAKREQVKLYHKALCNSLPVNGKIKLFHDGGNGLEDSLYRLGPSSEEVEATRFSDWLHEENICLEGKICLLRMNIEGAEYEVMQDLVASGLEQQIEGYFGMWDDLSKIDKQGDQEFRAFLSSNRISPFTFNGRDIGIALRTRCIQYEIETQVQAGLLKLARK